MPAELRESALTAAIIKVFFRVYDQLGYGLLESVYATCLAFELEAAGIPFVREAAIAVHYKGQLAGHFRADFLIDGKVIIELKATRNIDDADRRQLLNYMRCSTIELGLLLHFGPKPAFHRFIFDNDRKQGLAIYVNE
jgi:GxxExxY protein